VKEYANFLSDFFLHLRIDLDVLPNQPSFVVSGKRYKHYERPQG